MVVEWLRVERLIQALGFMASALNSKLWGARFESGKVFRLQGTTLGLGLRMWGLRFRAFSRMLGRKRACKCGYMIVSHCRPGDFTSK